MTHDAAPDAPPSAPRGDGRSTQGDRAAASGSAPAAGRAPASGGAPAAGRAAAPGGFPTSRGNAPASAAGGSTLRKQLLGGLVILLFLALFTLAVAVVIWLQLDLSPADVAIGCALVILVDVVLLAWFADYRLRRLVLEPVDRMVAGAERIAAGDEAHRLRAEGTGEMQRLSRAVNEMAGRLIRNQRLLAANVESLDRTNRALTEARNELIHAEKLASIGRLGAGIAHEIGNPLGALVGYVELARRREGQPAERLAEPIDGIAHEAGRIDRIVRGLLDFARPKTASVREVNVNEIVRRTTAMPMLDSRLKHLEVQTELEEPLPPIAADPFHLEQVMVNLLINAADAIEERGRGGPYRDASTAGRIEIRTRAIRYRLPPAMRPPRRVGDPAGIDYSHLRRYEPPPGQARTRRHADGEHLVEVIVADDGPGIRAEDEERVFDPFFSTKEPGRGTGLGLAVSARLVDAMGGTIEAGPRDGGGARFALRFPVAREIEREAPLDILPEDEDHAPTRKDATA